MKKKCIKMSFAATIPVAAKLLAMMASFIDSDVTEISVYDDEREFPDNDLDGAEEPADADEAGSCAAIHPFGCPD